MIEGNNDISLKTGQKLTDMSINMQKWLFNEFKDQLMKDLLKDFLQI